MLVNNLKKQKYHFYWKRRVKKVGEKRVIQIRNTIYVKLKGFADAKGLEVSEVLEEALQEFMKSRQ